MKRRGFDLRATTGQDVFCKSMFRRASIRQNAEDIMRRAIISGLAFVVLALMCCPVSVAQGPTADTSWETCLAAPTRACILDEALIRAFSLGPAASGATQLGNIAK